jgi:cell division septation protein DedD
MADESLREIQFNGKQLVFVFMAVTVVAVVIFLSGVMVGRTAPHGVALAASATDTPEVAMAPAPDGALDAQVVSAPTEGPVAADEGLQYPGFLEGTPPPETFEAPPVQAIAEPALDLPEEAPRPATPPTVATATATVLDAPVEAWADVAEEAALARPVDPGGWVVLVAAVRDRQAAESVAADLSGKGYQAFVTTPGPDAPLVYRVRVGAFPDRRAAEAVSDKLEREEQFEPWVTR